MHLEAEFDNGERILGESKIFYAKKLNHSHIRRVRLVPENPPALPMSLLAIEQADLIVIGPGSLYPVVERACREKRGERPPSVRAFLDSWREAVGRIFQ